MIKLARFVVCTFALIILSGYANSQEYWQEYERALNTFRAGETGYDEFSEKAAAKILDGIDGKWIILSILAPKIGDDELVGRACAGTYFEIAKDTDFSFLLTRRSGKQPDFRLDYRYTLQSDNVFTMSSDPNAVLEAFQMNTPDTKLLSKLHTLRGASGSVEVFRPSRDILVIKRPLEPAYIYGRCP
jgi:hypothetical protein